MISEIFAFIQRVLLYGIMFITSLFFVNKANKSLCKIKFIICSFMALLLPCLFAAFRAETVGTDVLHYVKPYYLSALSYDSLTGYLAQGSAEIGYEIFIYYIAKIFGCFQSILFFIELLVIIPVYMFL